MESLSLRNREQARPLLQGGSRPNLVRVFTNAPSAAGTPLERMPSSGTSDNPRSRYAYGVVFSGAMVLPLTETS